MRTKYKFLICASVIALAVSSCKKDDNDVTNPTNPNEEELITTMQVILTDSANTTNSWTFVYEDLDGDGGNLPVADTIHLEQNKTYYARIVLLDKTKTPVDTISNEVEEEQDDHLFVFEPHNPTLSVEITDKDHHNLPIGLESIWKTFSSPDNAHIHIRLKHQPGIKTGDPNLGETDIEAEFGVVIQ
jgi:hypothetical protein